jgi:Tfp pilus assembly protein PilN
MDMDRLVERQQLIKMVARERPDMLDLLELVNKCGERGIKLNSLHFKKGQLVTVTGQAGSNEQLRDFEKSLQEKKDIKEVNCTPSTDSKSRQITFKMTFHYKNFTKKKTKASSSGKS